MLTAKQIVEANIVTLSEENKTKYEIDLCPAQMGIDLHMISCARFANEDLNNYGVVYSDKSGKKTKIPKTIPLEPYTDNDGEKYWMLPIGEYEIGFAEGCNFTGTTAGKIVHRSSVRRCGNEINSPLWDPGFHTDEMGTFLSIKVPMRIYVGARVAQMMVWESKEEAEKYDGQWQGTGVLNGNH